jgi:hypothetical protein
VRNLWRRGPRAAAVPADPDGHATIDTIDAPATLEPAPTAEPVVLDAPAAAPWRSRRLWLGAIVLALLAALGGLAGWRLGWFGGPPRPKEILRQRLEAPSSSAAPTVVAPRPITAPPAPALGPLPESPVPAMRLGPLAAPPAPVDRSAPPAAPPKAAATVPGAPAAAARFAIEFGPFMTAPEAERVERQLNEAGYPTVRFRQQTGAALYAVLIEKHPTARDAQALVAALRQQGFAEAFVVGEREPLSVQVGLPLPLRGAVQTAERLRASGYQVRVAVQPGEAVVFALRHGNFATLGEAEAKGQELMRLGLGNQVVRVK